MVLILMLSLGGCTGKYKTPADTLVVGLEAQPATLDPRYATDAGGMRISGLIFEPLVSVGPGFKIVPAAAESWSHGKRHYRFFLRPGLKFHNGRAVSADDITYSFDYFRSGKSPFASGLEIIESMTASMESGRLVVDIQLQHDSDKFLLSDLPSVKILPKAEIVASENTFTRQLPGTGPYKFIKTDLNEIRLESVSAATRYLTFKIIRDDYTRYQKLFKGEIDMVQNSLPSGKIQEFEKHPDQFSVLRYPGLNMTYLLINFKDPILAQKPVREALAKSLKRDEIIQFKLNGLAREATSLLTPANPYFNGELSNTATDWEGARKIIDQLGLSQRRVILKTSNSPQAIDNGKVIAHQLSQSGLNVELESYEWATFYGDIKKGSFQLAAMKWVGNVDPDIYRSAFHSREFPPGRNRGRYLNSHLDQLLDRGTKEESPEQRRQTFKEVQKIVHEDIAILPLWYDEQVVVMRKNVSDFVPSLTSDFMPLTKARKREL